MAGWKGGWVGGGGRWGAIGRVKQTFKLKGSALPSVSDPDRHNSQGIGQACHQNQFGTPCSLINAPQGPQRPGEAPSRFDSVGKKPPVKADLAI